MPAAAAIELAAPALRVIAGRVFRLPYARLSVRIAVQQPRRFNILEEFILRAAAELAPPPTPAELAALLGLDPLFVDNTLNHLESLKAVARARDGGLTLTPKGRQFSAQGQVLQPAEHQSLSLLYLGALDELRLWAAPAAPPGDLAVLPGVTAEEREGLAALAQAAVKPPRVIAAAAAGGLELHDPAQGRLLTTVDHLAVSDIGFTAGGVLIVQDTLTGEASLRAVAVDTQAADAALQKRLDEWLAAGRVKLADFLPAEAELDGELGEAPDDAEPPAYAVRYREMLSSGGDDAQNGAGAKAGAGDGAAGVELLRAATFGARSLQLAQSVQSSLLLFFPRLTERTAGADLREDLASLAKRGVLTVVGWGTAGDRESEPVAPAAGIVDGLQRLMTPDGLPAVTVWWVGDLYGQDVVIDQKVLVSSVPNTLIHRGQQLPGGAATYLVTDPALVSAAVEDLEPAFARAARQGWHAAGRSPQTARQALARCCATWVAIRRPGEALSHLLKLAAQLAESEPGQMLVAWELLTLTCLALARLPAVDHAGMGTAEALRRGIPEFLDWADSALPPVAGSQPPFVAAFHDLLVRNSQLGEEDLAGLLAETQSLWAELGRVGGAQTTAEVFSVPAEADPKRDKLKKRRY